MKTMFLRLSLATLLVALGFSWASAQAGNSNRPDSKLPKLFKQPPAGWVLNQDQASTTPPAQAPRGQLVRNHSQRMLGRLEAAITRQEVLLDRIYSRIAKFKTDGVEVSQAEELVGEARAAVIAARDAANALRGRWGDALGADKLSNELAALKAETQETINLIKAAHQAIVVVITNLRGAVNR